MSYKSDGPISLPVVRPNVRSRFDLGGFGWHPDYGIFIPVNGMDDHIEEPYRSGIDQEGA